MDEPEIKASQHEIQDSDPQTQGEGEEQIPRLFSDIQEAAGADEADDQLEAAAESPDPLHHDETGHGDDDDDEPVNRGRAT